MKTCILKALAVAALAAWSIPAVSQDYPTKVITIVAPYPAGGSIDLVARLIGKRLGENMGQTVIVRNIPGAGGTVGTTAVAKSAPDGYTLLLASNGPNTIGPSLYTNLGYDGEKDFAPITLLAVQPMVFCVDANSPHKSMRELIAFGKTKDKRATYGTGGIGSAAHLTGEIFNSTAGTSFTHIPYKGTAPLAVAIISGELAMGVISAIDAIPQLKGGKLRCLAVSTSKRSPTIPDVPTIAEAGLPGFHMDVWYGLMAPANTPKAIVDRLQKETVGILAEPAISARFHELGAEATPTTSEQFTALVKSDIAKYARIVKMSGAKAE
jgi:tripartite-type tricarboxylate transporter receptor subunit TctC